MIIQLYFITTVIVLCAAPRKVREIMLAAEELGMVSSGEYVFFNIELLNRLAIFSTSMTLIQRTFSLPHYNVNWEIQKEKYNFLFI